jgi:hypothetical protein
MFTIAVDFDNTLIERDENGSLQPLSGAADAMRRLRAKGCRIVIYSCRTGLAAARRSLAAEVSLIENTLAEHNIVFDDIFIGEKMVADFYIDDRSIPFRGDWRETIIESENCIDKLAELVNSDDTTI